MRCDYCEHLRYQCPDCDERDYLEAGQRSVEREMRGRSDAARRFWQRGRR